MNNTLLSHDECIRLSGIYFRIVQNENVLCLKEKLYVNDYGSLLVSDSNELIGISFWLTTMETVPDMFLNVMPYKHWIYNIILAYKNVYLDN